MRKAFNDMKKARTILVVFSRLSPTVVDRRSCMGGVSSMLGKLLNWVVRAANKYDFYQALWVCILALSKEFGHV